MSNVHNALNLFLSSWFVAPCNDGEAEVLLAVEGERVPEAGVAAGYEYGST